MHFELTCATSLEELVRFSSFCADRLESANCLCHQPSFRCFARLHSVFPVRQFCVVVVLRLSTCWREFKIGRLGRERRVSFVWKKKNGQWCANTRKKNGQCTEYSAYPGRRRTVSGSKEHSVRCTLSPVIPLKNGEPMADELNLAQPMASDFPD